MNLSEIQRVLQEEHLDGWLFFDHHRRDPLAYRILGLKPERAITRRWYYFIPPEGEPVGLVHEIESFTLDGLPGRKSRYSSWDGQVKALTTLLSGRRRVAMAYSPKCAIPYVAMVDAGTVELIRSLGTEVVSAADLIQYFEARWSAKQLESHLEAGRRIDEIRREAFRLVHERIQAGQGVDEWTVKRFILDRFLASGLVTDHGPIVAVNKNSSNPHYEPDQQHSQRIGKGDILLIDMWAKLKQPGSVYYDITWSAFCGTAPPSKVEKVFGTVLAARDCAIQLVQKAALSKQALHGYQVDDAARNYIKAEGYGEYFIHRTGHSIGEEVHGTGANMDNLETHDERQIVPSTCFSIEPGVYLPEFGIRSEVNVFVDEKSARVTGEIQKELLMV